MGVGQSVESLEGSFRFRLNYFYVSTKSWIGFKWREEALEQKLMGIFWK